MSFASDIAKIVDTAYRTAVAGQSVTADINRRIDTYIKQSGLVGDARKELRREAKQAMAQYLRTRDALAEQRFNSQHRATESDVARINAMIAPDVERAEQRMERAASKILGRVGKLVELAARAGRPLRAIVARARSLASGADKAIKAELDTAVAGFDRTARMRGAVDAGVELFRYEGPRTNLRPFCRDTIERNGGIYTLAEIQRMDNGQGLPVENYCGGYNCRHRWVPIVQSESTTEPGANT